MLEETLYLAIPWYLIAIAWTFIVSTGSYFVIRHQMRLSISYELLTSLAEDKIINLEEHDDGAITITRYETK